MRIDSLQRAKKPSRRLPIAEIKDLFRDGRVHIELGKVFQPDGGASYHVNTQDGKRRVMIEVMTMPGGLDLTCRLATRPLWYIPTPGTLVIVAIPAGEIDHCPAVVGILDSGSADADIADTRTLLATELDLVLKAPTLKLGGVDADQALIKGDARKSDESDFLTAALTAPVPGLSVTFDSMSALCVGPLSGLKPGFTALKAAVVAFEAKLSGHLSTVSKTK